MVNTVREVVGKDIIFVIAGIFQFEKIDKKLIHENNVNVDAYCQKENCSHFYISKNGYNLEETFNSLITSVLKKIKILKEAEEENY